MNETPARLIPRPLPADVRRDLGTVAALLACVAAAFAVAPALRGPDHVDRVTVANPHPWHVSVAVTDGDGGGGGGGGGSGGGGSGWHPVGTVARDTRQSYDQVLDPGDTWTFRFGYAGHHADVRMSRASLAGDGWRVTVPDELAADLASAAVAETPP